MGRWTGGDPGTGRGSGIRAGLPGPRPDQQYRPVGPQGPVGSSTGIVKARIVVTFGTGLTGFFQYNGAPGFGNPPELWAVPPGVTLDPYRNPLPVSGGITSEQLGGGVFAQLFAGEIVLGDTLSADPLTSPGLMRIIHMAAHGADPIVAIDSPAADAAEAHASFWLVGAPAGGSSLMEAALFGLTHAGAQVPVEFIVCGNVNFGTIFGGLPTPEIWHTIGAASQPAFGAGFASAGAPTAPVGFQMEPIGSGGRVRLRGQVNLTAGQAAGATIFTLPAGYVPASRQFFYTPNNLSGAGAGSIVVIVKETGDVDIGPAGSNGNFVVLDGIVAELD